jgi:hypothetical protein
MWSSWPAAWRAWGTTSPCAQHWVSFAGGTCTAAHDLRAAAWKMVDYWALMFKMYPSISCDSAGICIELRCDGQAAARVCQPSSTSAMSS